MSQHSSWVGLLKHGELLEMEVARLLLVCLGARPLLLLAWELCIYFSCGGIASYKKAGLQHCSKSF